MTDEKLDWLSSPRVALMAVGAVALVLFVLGIVGAALFVTAVFALTGAWVVLWLRDIYRSDKAERAEMDRIHASDDQLSSRCSVPRYS